MGKIHVLDKQIAELIAAGEVVERPSSVIKELVENAIDAGASIVTVEVRNGGVTYMRVTDNGCGIAREDVATAFLRHATSKVNTKADLDSILTLGFRGEALASISAVAHIDLFTKVSGAEIGTHYKCSGGADVEVEDAGCPGGTTITVRDLFYNVPARMKFLKKDVAEGNAVSGLLDKIALSHPEISFRFIREGKEVLHTPGDGKLVSAIYAVFGKDFSKDLLSVDYTMNGIRVYGYVSSPIGSRPNRTMQNFFINGRFVRSRTAAVALEEAYKGAIMQGKFPACVLHLELPAEVVDVNVHPAKLEVRFANERPIFDAVYHGVKSAVTASRDAKVIGALPQQNKPKVHPYIPDVLPKAEQVVLSVSQSQKAEPPAVHNRAIPKSYVLSDQRTEERPKSLAQQLKSAVESVLDHDPVPVITPKPTDVPVYKAKPFADMDTPEPTVEVAAAQPETVAVRVPSVPVPAQKSTAFETMADKIIGEAFDTYIIVQHNADTLMFIDKHAAHERLLYEKLKSHRMEAAAQTLLTPVTITMDKTEYTSVLEHTEAFAQAGFEIEDFGAGTVLVRTAPLNLNGADIQDSVLEMAGYLAQNRNDMTTEHMDWLYHNIACRAAIKGGNFSKREELIALARQLEENPQVRYCPHGRPIYILLKKKTLEKEFGRI